MNELKVNRIGTLFNSNQGGAVYGCEGLSPNLCAAFHGYANGYFMVKALDEQNRYIHEDGLVGTLTTDGSSPKHNNRIMEITMEEVYEKALDTVPKDCRIRIRKLTPKECWRLMDFGKMQPDGSFDDSAFERAEKVNSNTQLYKQAGNSIVVAVLEAIFKEMM